MSERGHINGSDRALLVLKKISTNMVSSLRLSHVTAKRVKVNTYVSDNPFVLGENLWQHGIEKNDMPFVLRLIDSIKLPGLVKFCVSLFSPESPGEGTIAHMFFSEWRNINAAVPTSAR